MNLVANSMNWWQGVDWLAVGQFLAAIVSGIFVFLVFNWNSVTHELRDKNMPKEETLTPGESRSIGVQLNHGSYGTLRTIDVFVKCVEGEIPDTSLFLAVAKEEKKTEEGNTVPDDGLVLNRSLATIRESFGEFRPTPSGGHYRLDVDTQFKDYILVFLSYVDDGTPAADVPVLVRVSHTERLSWVDRTKRRLRR